MNTFKVILVTLLMLIIINISFLDWKVFIGEKTRINQESSNTYKNPSPLPAEITSNSIEENVCSLSCQNMIKEATSSIKTNTISNQNIPQTIYLPPKNNDIYIPLGVGSIKNTTWTDLSGIESQINSDDYKDAKEIYFEATLRIPTGNGKVFARLYNITDNHPVWFSDVSGEGQSGVLVRSGKISLDKGNKLYRVQMYTTLGYESILDNARIKIIFI